jgi:hypothetical protein
VSPHSLSLATTGDAAVMGQVVVGNTGAGPLHVKVKGPKHNPLFSIDNAAFTVPPSPAPASTVTVTYKPTKKGRGKDQLSITSDDPAQKKPIKVKLKGDSD